MEYKIYNDNECVASFSTEIILDVLEMVYEYGMGGNNICFRFQHDKKYGLILNVYDDYDTQIIKMKIDKINLSNFKCAKHFHFFIRDEDFEKMQEYLPDTNKITISLFDNDKIIYKLYCNNNKYEKILSIRQYIDCFTKIRPYKMNKYRIPTNIFNKYIENGDLTMVFDKTNVLLEQPLFTNYYEDEYAELNHKRIDNCSNSNRIHVKCFVESVLDYYMILSKKYEPENINIYVDSGIYDFVIKFRNPLVGSLYFRDSSIAEYDTHFICKIESSYGSRIRKKNIDDIENVLSKCSIADMHVIFVDAHHYDRNDICTYIINNYRDVFDNDICDDIYDTLCDNQIKFTISDRVKKILSNKTKSAIKN